MVFLADNAYLLHRNVYPLQKKNRLLRKKTPVPVEIFNLYEKSAANGMLAEKGGPIKIRLISYLNFYHFIIF